MKNYSSNIATTEQLENRIREEINQNEQLIRHTNKKINVLIGLTIVTLLSTIATSLLSFGAL